MLNYIKKYFRLFIINIVVFIFLGSIVTFREKNQKSIVAEAKLIIENSSDNKKQENPDLITFIYPTSDIEPSYQKVLDNIVNSNVVSSFIYQNHYNFEIVSKAPRNMKIYDVEFNKNFDVNKIFEFKTNVLHPDYYIKSDLNGFVKIRFLKIDKSVSKFLSHLNLRITNSSEYIKSKSFPQFVPNMISIQYEGKDFYEYQIFRKFIDFLFRKNLEEKKFVYLKLKELLRNQIEFYNNEIDHIDDEIKNIKLALVSNPDFIKEIVNQEYQTQLEIHNLENYLKHKDTLLITSDEPLLKYLAALHSLKDTLKILSLKYGEQSNEYKFIKLSIDTLKVNLSVLVNERLDFLKEKLSNIRQMKIFLKNVINNSIELENRISMLNSKKQAVLDILSLLNKKLKETEIEEVGMKNDFKLFYISSEPRVVGSGRGFKFNLLFSFLFSICFSIGQILVIEYLRNTIRDTDELELKFDLKNVFDIPYIASESQRPLRVFLDQDYEQIIKGSHGLESFRILVLRSLIENEKVKMPSTIGLISSVQNEGKSFLCANLASTIAMMKKDVVIIDVDLRKSALSYHFFPNNNEGLSNLLDIKDFDSVIFRIADNFYLVPSGNKPIDPLAIFLSNRFKELLSYLKNQFDFIILDLPPIIGLSEATVITNQLDYLIFVIRYDSTKISEIKTALRSIKKDKVIAYVLNGVLPKRAYYEYYYAKKKHEIS